MNTILVPVDFSDATPGVIATAEDLATATHAKLVLLNVAAPDPEFIGYGAGPGNVVQDVARDFQTETQHLEEWKSRIHAPLEVDTLHLQGPTVDKILDVAEREKPNWIVMGSHGHSSMHQMFIGSVTHDVMRRAHCPVVVVRADK